MSKNYEKLENLIEEGKKLKKALFPDEYDRYQIRVLHIVESIFGDDSRQAEKIKYVSCDSCDSWVSLNVFDSGKMVQSITDIETLLELYLEDVPKEKVVEKEAKKIDRTKAFIVHGHDDVVKTEVESLLRKLNIEPIILHRQTSSSNTIIEKIERYSNVGFGIVLYTPCDVGNTKDKKDELNFRARQNVVFEHGFLIGKIGRKNVCA